MRAKARDREGVGVVHLDTLDRVGNSDIANDSGSCLQFICVLTVCH